MHDSRSDEHLELMRAWKARQRRASGTKDQLEDGATWAALRALFREESPRCRGLLSVLEAGGVPVALHFGLVTQTTLHVWFPTYDGHERCSPGAVLLLDTMREAGARGALRVDLGTGDDRYKRSFQNGAAHVLELHADRRRFAGAVGRAKNGVDGTLPEGAASRGAALGAVGAPEAAFRRSRSTPRKARARSREARGIRAVTWGTPGPTVRP